MKKRLMSLVLVGILGFGVSVADTNAVFASKYAKSDSAYCNILKRYLSIEKAVDKYAKKSSSKISYRKKLDIELAKLAIKEAEIYEDSETVSQTLETINNIASIYSNNGDTTYSIKDFNKDGVNDLAVFIGVKDSDDFVVQASAIYTFDGKKAGYIGTLDNYADIKSDIDKVIELTKKSASEVKSGNYEYNGVSSYSLES